MYYAAYIILLPIPILIVSIIPSIKLKKKNYIYSFVSLILIVTAYILFKTSWDLADEYGTPGELFNELIFVLITLSYVFNYLQIKSDRKIT